MTFCEMHRQSGCNECPNKHVCSPRVIYQQGGRAVGKTLHAAAQLVQDIQAGRNSILIGKDYVVISRKQYDKLWNKTKHTPTESLTKTQHDIIEEALAALSCIKINTNNDFKFEVSEIIRKIHSL